MLFTSLLHFMGFSDWCLCCAIVVVCQSTGAVGCWFVYLVVLVHNFVIFGGFYFSLGALVIGFLVGM